MTPLLGGDASGASHPSTGTPNAFRPNTLRNNNVGTYIRDQWNLTPKITASVGLRWEYYSLPRRADHGIEVYDFDANRLLICDVGPNEPDCGIEVEKNLFTPRLGIAYRPVDTLVIRAGYSRNPQSNNPGRQQMVPSQSFPQTIVINEAAPNNVTAVGSLSEGATIVRPADQSSGVLVLPRGAGVNTYRDEYVRGKISSWNLSVQKALGQTHERDGRVRGEPSERDDTEQERQLRHAGRRRGEPALLPTGHQFGDEHLYRGRQGAVRLAAAQHEPPDERGHSVHGRLHVLEDDQLVGTGIPIPEYFHLNKAETGRPHRLNASLIYELPFGSGRKWLNDDGIVANIAGGWQLNTFFSHSSGAFVTVTSNANVLNAPGTTTQFADKVKDGPVEVFGESARRRSTSMSARSARSRKCGSALPVTMCSPVQPPPTST